MNITNESCLPSAQHPSIPALVCVVFSVGFLLNVFSLWVFCCRLSSWSAGTVLQFNLALSDALATPVTPLIAAYFLNGHDWAFGRFLCQVKIALMSSHFYGSTTFLTLISVHRYKAVVRFNQSSRMKNKSFIKKICVGVWLLLLAQSLVYSFVVPPTKVNNRVQCLSFSQRTLSNSMFVINFVLFLFGFLLPLGISSVCYSRVTTTLFRLNTSTAKGLKVKLKSQSMIRMCIVIFCMCYLPMNVSRTAAAVLTKYFPHVCVAVRRVQTAYYASWILAGLNCCMDPLLYCFGSQKFREAFPSFRQRQTENQQSESETNL
ncbi:unnamed protein product [Knipowitschia caucasica]